MNNKNETLPLKLLQVTQKLYAEIREVVKENSDLIRIEKDEDFAMIISKVDINSSFFFKIENPKLEKNKISYEITQKPSDSKSISIHHYNVEYNDTSNTYNTVSFVFSRWLIYIKEYESINIHPNSKVFNSYKEEIFKSFHFLEDVNDDKPINLKTQKELKHFILLTIEAIKDEDDVDETVIVELKELNKDIAKLTQREFKNRFSWVIAKVIYNGVDIINYIAKKGSDAGFGYIFIEGVRKALGG